MIVRKRASYEVECKVKVGLCLQLDFASLSTSFSYQRKVGEEQLDELINEFYMK